MLTPQIYRLVVSHLSSLASSAYLVTMAAGHDKQKNNLRPAPDPEPPPEEQGQPEIPNSPDPTEEQEQVHGKNNPALPAPQAQATRPQRRSRVEFDFRTRPREWID